MDKSARTFQYARCNNIYVKRTFINQVWIFNKLILAWYLKNHFGKIWNDNKRWLGNLTSCKDYLLTFLYIYGTSSHITKPSVARLTHNWSVVVWAPSKALLFPWPKKLYPYCLVLVGSRNIFECHFIIKLKYIQGLMEDWLYCQMPF